MKRDKFRCPRCKRVVEYTFRHLALADGGNALGYIGTPCQFPKFKARMIKKYGKNWRALREAWWRNRRRYRPRRDDSNKLRRLLAERERLTKRIKALEAKLHGTS